MRNPKGSERCSPLSEILGLYRATRAALLPPSCRFVPSCSEYAEQAAERFGVLRSLPLILSRLLRCHPFHPGGHDPVPARPKLPDCAGLGRPEPADFGCSGRPVDGAATAAGA